MTGKILDYSIADSKGIISAEDGNRYEFINSEWKSDKAPQVNQVVDFVIEEKQAKGIYLVLGNSFSTDDALETAKEKVNTIKNSETLSNVMEKKDKILAKGVQFKYGFTLTFLMILAYFLPVIAIPFVGNLSMWNGSLGSYAISALLILGFLFYSGAKALPIRITTSIVILIIFLQYYNFISELQDIGSFGMRGHGISDFIKFGNIIIIPIAILLAFAGLFKRDKK